LKTATTDMVENAKAKTLKHEKYKPYTAWF